MNWTATPIPTDYITCPKCEGHTMKPMMMDGYLCSGCGLEVSTIDLIEIKFSAIKKEAEK